MKETEVAIGGAGRMALPKGVREGPLKALQVQSVYLRVASADFGSMIELSLFLGKSARGAGGDAAVHEKGLAGDVGAGVGSEEDDGAFEVLGMAGAL